MALVMMQGHVFDALVYPASRADPLYLLQAVLHGSTAPGFLLGGSALATDAGGAAPGAARP